MSEEETTLLDLFDSYWFEYGVFSEKKIPNFSTVRANPVVQVQTEFEKPKLKPIKTQMRKSLSDQFLSSKDCSDSPSPDSVLVPQLQTILSGKEIEELPGEKEDRRGSSACLSLTEPPLNGGEKRRRRRTLRKGNGKSLSELEFEELKGFMDLGFVFSGEDNDSRLASIIPGLQRLGKNRAEEPGEVSVSRPYLSEAWEFLGEELKNPLMDWRIPAFGNETELKHHLRDWAHTVASTVFN